MSNWKHFLYNFSMGLSQHKTLTDVFTGVLNWDINIMRSMINYKFRLGQMKSIASDFVWKSIAYDPRSYSN